MPKLSAIMPTFNRAVYLPEAIESVRQQSYKDWELIVVDDGSTDSTHDLLSWYRNVDNRIKYIRRKKNMGVGYTRNEAIAASQGDIIVQCDSDDVQLPNRFQEIAKAFGQDKKLDVFYHSFFVCDQVLTIKMNRVAMPFRMDKLFESQYILGTCAYRRRVWKDVPYNSKLKVGEEWEFLVRCGLAKMKFGWTKKPLMKYRVNSSSLSMNFFQEVSEQDKKLISALKKKWDGKEY